MSEKKYTYRVKAGRRWGPYNEYGPGSTVELTQEEAEPFSDTLALVKSKDVPDDQPDEAAHMETLTVPQLKNLPEWEKVEPPRPTAKKDIIEAILAVRAGK